MPSEPTESTGESRKERMQEAMEEMGGMDAIIGGGIASFATELNDLADVAENINLVFGRGAATRLGRDKAAFDLEHAWVMVKNAHKGCALTREEWQTQLKRAGKDAFVGTRSVKIDPKNATDIAESQITVNIYRCTDPINPYLAPVLNTWPFDVPAHRPLPCCKFCPCLPRWCRETPKPTFAYQDDTKPRNGEAQQCNPVYITRPVDLPPNGQYFEHASAIQRTSIDAAEEKNALDTVEMV